MAHDPDYAYRRMPQIRKQVSSYLADAKKAYAKFFQCYEETGGSFKLCEHLYNEHRAIERKIDRAEGEFTELVFSE
jgi:hypothetical protein